ncbi:hypothetical protein [uncultured Maribacter sp.]|nr:hypothetical protein [uncultured Maribacter sp.]
MKYLSPEIEAILNSKKKSEKSLVKKNISCGIFQDYEITEDNTNEELVS